MTKNEQWIYCLKTTWHPLDRFQDPSSPFLVDVINVWFNTKGRNLLQIFKETGNKIYAFKIHLFSFYNTKQTNLGEMYK